MGLKEFQGEYGQLNPLPEIAGTYSGNLIICADAACIWDDLERFGARDDKIGGCVYKPGWDIMTINKMVETMPAVLEHAFGNGPSDVLHFVAARRPEYVLAWPGPKHTHSINQGCKWTWPFAGHGTSGLGGTLAAVGMGYQKIVLCGMPLNNTGHNGEPPWRTGGFVQEAADSVGIGENWHWRRARELAFEGKVRSMSGRTKDWLGDAICWRDA